MGGYLGWEPKVGASPLLSSRAQFPLRKGSKHELIFIYIYIYIYENDVYISYIYLVWGYIHRIGPDAKTWTNVGTRHERNRWHKTWTKHTRSRDIPRKQVHEVRRTLTIRENNSGHKMWTKSSTARHDRNVLTHNAKKAGAFFLFLLSVYIYIYIYLICVLIFQPARDRLLKDCLLTVFQKAIFRKTIPRRLDQ